MPESKPHHDTLRELELSLMARIARDSRDALVAVNLGCRWNRAKPQIGVDPDIALIEPAPPEDEDGDEELDSLRTWLPGHVPPRFAIEVVSSYNPKKDYIDAPVKYGRLGTRELVVFDPALRGPRQMGPYVIQVWRRDEEGAAMVRVYAGEGPAYSQELGAWLIPFPHRHLRIADDAEGRSLWLTEAEAAQGEAEVARSEAEVARSEADAARSEADAARRAHLTALRTGIADLCDALGIELTAGRRERLASSGADELAALRARLKAERAWPS